MGNHLIDGEFQSDKYPETRRGFVPLKCSDIAAQPLLWAYAQAHRAIDGQFSADLKQALINAGFDPNKALKQLQLEEIPAARIAQVLAALDAGDDEVIFRWEIAEIIRSLANRLVKSEAAAAIGGMLSGDANELAAKIPAGRYVVKFDGAGSYDITKASEAADQATEQMLCNALGRQWQPVGMSVENLVLDVLDRLSQQHVALEWWQYALGWIAADSWDNTSEARKRFGHASSITEMVKGRLVQRRMAELGSLYGDVETTQRHAEMEEKRRLEHTPAAGPLSITGVGRDADHPASLVTYFSRPLSDDEMRAFHDFVKHFTPAAGNGNLSTAEALKRIEGIIDEHRAVPTDRRT